MAALFGTGHCVGLSPLHTLLSRARRQRSNFSGKSFRARGLKRPRHISAGFCKHSELNCTLEGYVTLARSTLPPQGDSIPQGEEAPGVRSPWFHLHTVGEFQSFPGLATADKRRPRTVISTLWKEGFLMLR